MTNLEKMNELVGSTATKDQIVNWAYMNRILVNCLHLEDEFEEMRKSVVKFVNTDTYLYSDNEFDLWHKFLDSEFVY
jgi:hypothetical protein